MLRICVAGLTGWTGKSVALAIAQSNEFELVAAISRKAVGQDIGTVLGLVPMGVKVVANVTDALETPIDVFIDYTKPDIVKTNVLLAISKMSQ